MAPSTPSTNPPPLHHLIGAWLVAVVPTLVITGVTMAALSTIDGQRTKPTRIEPGEWCPALVSLDHPASSDRS